MSTLYISSERLFNMPGWFDLAIVSFSVRQRSHRFEPQTYGCDFATTDHFIENDLPWSVRSQTNFVTNFSVMIMCGFAHILVLTEFFISIFQFPLKNFDENLSNKKIHFKAQIHYHICHMKYAIVLFLFLQQGFE